MVFSSLEFIFLFLPAFFLVYAIVPGTKLKNLVILVGSILFYSMGVLGMPVYILLFVQTILINYILGRFIQSYPRFSRIWLILGIIYDLWWLLYFKYAGFFAGNVNALLHTSLPVRDILLPIGISFYTFQNISYLADVYWKRVRAADSVIDYGAYISMFPQLIAGPIVNFKTVRAELIYRTHSLQKIEKGLRVFTLGLGYKVLIANQLGGLWRDIDTIGFDSISTPMAWMGIAAYSFQLYFDFYGYSLMSIGLGLMMGFHLPENFHDPYQSLTMTDFWRRWHITLGTWFREYIYIPLGGNRVSLIKNIRNMLVVWLLTGFWHGASWNFILWGLFLFVVLVIEKFFIGKFMQAHPTIGHFYMFLLIPISWALFCITDLHDMGMFFQRLLPFIPHEKFHFMEGDYSQSWQTYWKYFIPAALCCTDFPKWLGKKLERHTVITAVGYAAAFIACIYCMHQGLDDPFMYFRF